MSARYTERMRLARAEGLSLAPPGLTCSAPRYRARGAACGRTAVYVTAEGQPLCGHHRARRDQKGRVIQ